MVVAVGKLGRPRSTSSLRPAISSAFGLQLLGDQAVEQGRSCSQPPVVGLEQIAQHDAARRLIGVDADELARLSEARTVVSVSMRRI
jgi:hypothetical protein